MRKNDIFESITTPSDEIARAYRQSLENDHSDHSLAAIHYRGGQTEFDLGREYALSSDPLDRITGADILAQLGWGDDTFHHESVDLLLPLANDSDQRVVAAAAYALGHRKSARGIPVILPLIHHQNADVRLAAVSGLTGQDDPSAIQGLVELAKDTVPEIRSWAAFGLGTISDTDSTEIRDALAPLLDDPDAEIRGEALIGLAKRRDARALPALIRELKGDFYGSWSLEAAELVGNPQLLPLLIGLRDSVPTVDAVAFSGDFDRAISSCAR
jgi:HEAT repeat protein